GEGVSSKGLVIKTKFPMFAYVDSPISSLILPLPHEGEGRGEGEVEPPPEWAGHVWQAVPVPFESVILPHLTSPYKGEELSVFSSVIPAPPSVIPAKAGIQSVVLFTDEEQSKDSGSSIKNVEDDRLEREVPTFIAWGAARKPV
ncbi:MAG: hypothetical protein OXH80_02315, partial [Nitrospira sp.]|nr:hypothetical protein [Nitrospira sp.]